MKCLIRLQFPTVPSISTAELADWLARSDASQPLLCDVRTAAEFAVSHLPQAHRVDPDEQTFADIQTLREASIVTYCSVGYRSAVVAQRLQAAGFTQVSNLEGSLFQWANEGRLLVRGDSVVHQVHPSGPLWGGLLRQDLHADRADLSHDCENRPLV